MKTMALALGGGGARGFGHIAVLEALDDLGIRPVALSGASIGALVAAAYAAGMSGKDIRRHAVSLAHNRGETFRRLLLARAGRFADIFSGGIGGATLVDAEKLCAQFLPEAIPEDFESLSIPLSVVTSDLYRRCETVLSAGPLRPALAASMALPGLVRPVAFGEAVLIDGSATNPLPFDHLHGRADVVVAIDISGGPASQRRDIPNMWEALAITVHVMGSALMSEKLKRTAPDLIVRPNVGAFRMLDFFQASSILRAAEPIKADIRERLLPMLE